MRIDDDTTRSRRSGAGLVLALAAAALTLWLGGVALSLGSLFPDATVASAEHASR